jgi:uncharacterized UBP type Zn finger protein
MFTEKDDDPYLLHSIVVHDGNPASVGIKHWYSLIYDFAQEKWRKYNDS